MLLARFTAKSWNAFSVVTWKWKLYLWMLSWRYFLYIQSQEYISYFLISPVRPIRNMEWRVQEDRNVSYVGIENPFVKTFATVLLTSLVPDSPTWINFAFHRKAGRDILSSQRTYRQYIVCYNDNLHFHVFSDHCTIHLCLGVFAIGLFSSRWMGITSVPS